MHIFYRLVKISVLFNFLKIDKILISIPLEYNYACRHTVQLILDYHIAAVYVIRYATRTSTISLNILIYGRKRRKNNLFLRLCPHEYPQSLRLSVFKFWKDKDSQFVYISVCFFFFLFLFVFVVVLFSLFVCLFVFE